NFTPDQISPIPVIQKKESRRGGKPGVSAIITLSPYKQQLQQKQELRVKNPGKGKSKVKQVKSASGKLLKETSTTFVEDTSSSEDEQISIHDESSDGKTHDDEVPESGDSQCIFCDAKCSDDVQGETWIQCTRYGLWCHADCADCEFGVYVCDFCK
ncbi:hypothetical protein L9F63_009122, partial [Diploptera punctata]